MALDKHLYRFRRCLRIDSMPRLSDVFLIGSLNSKRGLGGREVVVGILGVVFLVGVRMGRLSRFWRGLRMLSVCCWSYLRKPMILMLLVSFFTHLFCSFPKDGYLIVDLS